MTQLTQQAANLFGRYNHDEQRIALSFIKDQLPPSKGGRRPTSLKQRQEVLELLDAKCSENEAAVLTGLSRSTIQRIKRGG